MRHIQAARRLVGIKGARAIWLLPVAMTTVVRGDWLLSCI